MDIKSSLVNSKDMKLVKDSLIKISEIDHEENFRVDMLEYINDSIKLTKDNIISTVERRK